MTARASDRRKNILGSARSWIKGDATQGVDADDSGEAGGNDRMLDCRICVIDREIEIQGEPCGQDSSAYEDKE